MSEPAWYRSIIARPRRLRSTTDDKTAVAAASAEAQALLSFRANATDTREHEADEDTSEARAICAKIAALETSVLRLIDCGALMTTTLVRCIVGALVALCATTGVCAETAATSADVAALQEQTRTLDRDVASLREASAQKLDAQDKRIDSLGYSTAQQANYLAAISVQTASVANYIAFTSIGITLIVFFAGFITYFSATARAVKEANEASQAWFTKNGSDLDARLADLRKEVEAARGEIDQIRKRVKDEADEASKGFSELGRKLFAAFDPDQRPATSAPDPTTVAAVQEKSESLRAKPEADFTADDYWTRGLADFSSNRYDAALQAFRYGLALVEGVPAAREMHAQLLFAIGATLGQLARNDEALAIYDEIERLYASDNAPSLRQFVTGALFNKGFVLMQTNRLEEARAVYSDIDQRFGQDPDPTMREQVANMLINLGIVFCQLDRNDEALKVYAEILRRYAPDATPAFVIIRSKTLNNAAYSRILLAKKGWSAATERDALLLRAIEDAQRASEDRTNEARGNCLGNLGYALFLHRQQDEAEKATREALRLDGKKALDTQRADAQRFRVEPEDTHYEAMLTHLWEGLD